MAKHRNLFFSIILSNIKMKKFLQSNVNCNCQQILKLKLLDESTNTLYKIEVGKEDYNCAHKDNDFANMLLEKAKALCLNYSAPSNCYISPVSSSVDNNKPSCSKSSVQYDNTSDIENYNEDGYNQNERDKLNMNSNEGRWTHKTTFC